jgi:uncharacterized protein (TIGR03083 family)
MSDDQAQPIGERLAGWYAAGRTRVSELIASLSEAQLAAPVPACPGWTVHDTFAHLVSNPIDGLAGKLAGGPPDDAATAEQVDRWRGAAAADMVAAWHAADAIDDVIRAVGADIAPIVIDLHTHEQDICNALGMPGARDVEAMRWIDTRFRSFKGAVPVDDYELFRAVLGRRSAAQVAAWEWATVGKDGPAENFFIFGPRSDDLVE